MEGKFLRIKKEYDNFDKAMLKQGQLPMWDTGVGFYSSARIGEIFDLFKRIGLQNYSHFLDLGSGDGRVVSVASLFTKASGVEIDPKLVSTAINMNARLGLNANFVRKNFYDYNISYHDLVFVNPDQPMHRGLENKLLSELRGHLVVFGNHFHPTLLRKKSDFDFDGNYAALYSI